MTPKDQAHPVTKRRKTKLLAIVATITFALFLIGRVLQFPFSLNMPLFVLASLPIALLLIHGYVVLGRVEQLDGSFSLRAHMLLHIVPYVYIVVHFFASPSFLVNGAFLVPISAFFLTGRRTWKTLDHKFPSKMYKIFVKGNTGLLISLPTVFFLGLVYDRYFGTEVFYRLLMFYFLTHLMLTGVAVLKISKDCEVIAPRS